MGSVVIFTGMSVEERRTLAYLRLMRWAIGLGPKMESAYQRLMHKAGLRT